jgi:hypothetical protein
MWMFWAFKISFDLDILLFLTTLFQKFGKILFNFLVTLGVTLASDQMSHGIFVIGFSGV